MDLTAHKLNGLTPSLAIRARIMQKDMTSTEPEMLFSMNQKISPYMPVVFR